MNQYIVSVLTNELRHCSLQLESTRAERARCAARHIELIEAEEAWAERKRAIQLVLDNQV